MYENTLVIALAVFTLVAALGFGIWQRFKVEKAKKENRHSALSEGRPELRKEHSSPSTKSQ